MYKCNDCKKTFEEVATWRESRGECFGYPAYETMWGCPFCYSGDYEEVKEDEEDDG